VKECKTKVVTIKIKEKEHVKGGETMVVTTQNRIREISRTQHC
jgi:hypothetical protein